MRILWADLANARRQLIESHVLDNDPFLNRLWHHHLRWLYSFVKSAMSTKVLGIGWMLRMRYRKMADRLFGGTREDQYCEKLNHDDECRREKVSELKKLLRENEERRFNRELHYHERTNPNFVATPHTQDRH